MIPTPTDTMIPLGPPKIPCAVMDKPQDFLTLTGAARRARSEGYDITYHSLRNLVAAGYISHVPNGSRIYIFYPNLVNFIQNGLTAEQSLEYQLSRARN